MAVRPGRDRAQEVLLAGGVEDDSAAAIAVGRFDDKWAAQHRPIGFGEVELGHFLARHDDGRRHLQPDGLQD